MKHLISLLLFPLILSACAVSDNLTDAEKEFNNSGQAKALEDLTDLWMVYENEEAGFSFKYPHSVTMDKNETGAILILEVSSDKIEGLEGTMGYNEETAIFNMEALKKGIYGEGVDFPLEESKKVREIDGVFAQDFLVLGRFEVCNVTFERKLYFFHNNNQIVITLHGGAGEDKKVKLMIELADFFTTNPENCGEELIWEFEEIPNLYSLLESGSGSKFVQEWFDTFDDIVETIELTEDTQAQLQGIWTSEDDPLSQIEFTESIQRQIYDSEVMSEDVFSVSNESPLLEFEDDGKYLLVESDFGQFNYKILKITSDELELMYLPRGNVLRYRR